MRPSILLKQMMKLINRLAVDPPWLTNTMEAVSICPMLTFEMFLFLFMKIFQSVRLSFVLHVPNMDDEGKIQQCCCFLACLIFSNWTWWWKVWRTLEHYNTGRWSRKYIFYFMINTNSRTWPVVFHQHWRKYDWFFAPAYAVSSPV